MDTLVAEFLDYLRFERRRSELTVKSYDEDLGLFVDYVRQLDESLSWQSVDQDIIRGWVESMMDKGNTATSVNRRLSCLRSFYRFALARKKVTHDPVYRIKGPKKAKPLPQYLREDEMEKLLGMDIQVDNYKDVRARTIILVFYSTGIRLSELVGLNDASVDFVARQLKVLGKRDKERIIPFGSELAEVLGAYQRLRNETLGFVPERLFVTYTGQRMTASQVRRLVGETLAKVTTLKKKSPHVLRHTFATAMLNNESSLESVQKLLGHESIATTEIYTHTTFEQLRKVYTSSHPRGEKDESNL